MSNNDVIKMALDALCLPEADRALNRQFVYIATNFKKSKVGRSINPVKRCKNISTQSGSLAFPFAIIKPKLNVNLEKILHKKLECHLLKIKGLKPSNHKCEWFNLNPYELLNKCLDVINENSEYSLFFSSNSKSYVNISQLIKELELNPNKIYKSN